MMKTQNSSTSAANTPWDTTTFALACTKRSKPKPTSKTKKISAKASSKANTSRKVRILHSSSKLVSSTLTLLLNHRNRSFVSITHHVLSVRRTGISRAQ